MPAVDAEMRIGRHYSAARELLGHADQAGIGQRHGQAPVCLLEFQQPFDLVLHAEGDVDRSPLNELKDRPRIAPEPRDEELRFREHRLAGQERRLQFTYEKSYLARLNYTHRNAVKHKLVPVANQYPWCSAAWFERTATPAQVKTIYGFKTDRAQIYDEYDTAPEW